MANKSIRILVIATVFSVALIVVSAYTRSAARTLASYDLRAVTVKGASKAACATH